MEKTGRVFQNLSALNLTVKFVITRISTEKDCQKIKINRITTYWKFLIIQELEDQKILRMRFKV